MRRGTDRYNGRVPLLDIHLGISPSLPLDSVVWYRVYTCSERSDKDGYPLDWTSGTESRSRRGNGAVLRARGLVGGTAAPGLWLSSVLRAGGHASPLYQARTKAGLLAQRDYRAIAAARGRTDVL